MENNKSIMAKWDSITKIRSNVIFQSFSYLSFIQMLTLVVPLITYSYMIRTLGKENYGLIAFATSITSYISIIVNFGFNITATKNVSLFRNDQNKLSLIVSSVLLIKVILFFFSYVIFFVILVLTGLKVHLYFFLLMGLLAINDFAQPVWFYQGVEKLFNVTAVTLFNRIFFMILMFLFIKTENDILLVPIIQVIGIILCLTWLYYDLAIRRKIVIYIPKTKSIVKYFKESLPFFTSRLSGVVSIESNSILIGAFLGYKEVATYDLAKKIINMLLIPFSILNDAIYPNVVRSKDMTFMKKIIIVVSLTSLFTYLVLQIFSSSIIELLAGKDLLEAKDLLVYLGCLIPLNAITYFLGNTVLVVMNKNKEFNMSVIISFVSYAIFSIVFILFNKWNILTAALVLILSALIQTVLRFVFVKKYKFL